MVLIPPSLKGRFYHWVAGRIPLPILVAAMGRIMWQWAYGVRDGKLLEINPLDAVGGRLLCYLMELDGISEDRMISMIRSLSAAFTAECGVPSVGEQVERETHFPLFRNAKQTTMN